MKLKWTKQSKSITADDAIHIYEIKTDRLDKRFLCLYIKKRNRDLRILQDKVNTIEEAKEICQKFHDKWGRNKKTISIKQYLEFIVK